jgi:hypothetical protein
MPTPLGESPSLFSIFFFRLLLLVLGLLPCPCPCPCPFPSPSTFLFVYFVCILLSGSVNTVAFVPPSDMIAGTDTMLWRLVGGERWVFFRVPGIIDGPIQSLSVDSQGTLWIGNDVCVNLQHQNLTFERIGYQQGKGHFPPLFVLFLFLFFLFFFLLLFFISFRIRRFFLTL